MKRALIVGIDHYNDIGNLKGCVNDANKISHVMRVNDDGSPNFDVQTICSNIGMEISRPLLGDLLEKLLTRPADMAFFYFAGHGTITNLGGYICTSDARKYNEGYSMQDLITLVNNSPIKEIVIILDCCHCGKLGEIPSLASNTVSFIKEGVSILASCRKDEISVEIDGSGLFTTLVCDALSGGAADLRGIVTPAGIYSHVEQCFGAWDQRPLFKSHVCRSTPLRKTTPKASSEDLRQLLNLFVNKNDQHKLDRSYEFSQQCANEENVDKFKVLKKLQIAGLIKVNRDQEPDLYWACIENKPCELTPSGKFYWDLVFGKKI